jgi:phospholipase/carboxylesterase
MLIEPGILQGAILLRPMLVYEPAERNDLTGAAVFISAGRMDPIVPTASVDRLVELFESVRAEVTLKWQLAGHNLVPGEVRDAAEWLALRRTRV